MSPDVSQAMVAGARVLHLKHTTTYVYDRNVEASVHRLHLKPIHDIHQYLLKYKLRIKPDTPFADYEDVFGNFTTHFKIDKPYRELEITAESTVALIDFDPFCFAKAPIRPAFPLVWMPWEHLMLQPYLQPVELAETQLRELSDYAMSFVTQNDGDLLETLFQINLHMFRDYQYVSGSTSLETTPYQVFTQRRGVCQDFANLFICLARLLGIPARYVCGYVYTGNNSESRTRSDASHAWLSLYLPQIGWTSFDPTNGVLPTTDHVRVAYGRHYRDTAPTSGTLYSEAKEEMKIDVVVEVQ